MKHVYIEKKRPKLLIVIPWRTAGGCIKPFSQTGR
jgi:hypothetical protein